MSEIYGLRCNYATITAAGTYNVSTTSAFLHVVNINDTTAGNLIVCDGTAAAAATVATIICGTPGTQLFDVDCGSGLKIVTTGNSNVTISYAKL